MIHVAVLGGSGFIGNALVRHFSNQALFRATGYASSDADLTRKDETEKLAGKMPRNAALVIAAADTRSPADSPRSLKTNLRIGMNIARLISSHRFRHVVFLSSVDVYGRTNLSLPLSETSKVCPETRYAVSKRVCELLISRTCLARRVPSTILRLPGVYGPGDRSNRIVPRILASALTGKTLVISGNGAQRRDLLYVGDAARLTERVIARRITGVFNAVTGKADSINDIAQTIEEIAGRRLSRKYKRTSRDQVNLVFRKSALLKHMREFKLTDLRAGLRITYESAEHNSCSRRR